MEHCGAVSGQCFPHCVQYCPSSGLVDELELLEELEYWLLVSLDDVELALLDGGVEPLLADELVVPDELELLEGVLSATALLSNGCEFWVRVVCAALAMAM